MREVQNGKQLASRGHYVDRKFRDFVLNKLRFKVFYSEYKKFRNTSITIESKVERLLNCCYSYDLVKAVAEKVKWNTSSVLQLRNQIRI